MKNLIATSAPGEKHQGVVVLLMFALLFVSGVTVVLTVIDNNAVAQRRAAATGAALQKAKEALIAFAVLHGDYYGAAGAGPGHLFCPDTNNNGLQNTPCAANVPGRLPRTITLPSGVIFPLSSFGANEDQQFWYGVSPAFKYSPAGVLNSSTVGALTLDGMGDIAAVIIAPGAMVAGQARVNNTISNYLEGANTTLPNLASSLPSDPDNFNDRVLVITRREINSPSTARVAERIKVILAGYHAVKGFYPPNQMQFDTAMTGLVTGPPVVIPAMPAWYANNNWPANTVYDRLSSDIATIAFNGCGITYTLNFLVPGLSKSQPQC
jgi:type II secretory pathway pseudopilin PulG